MKRLIKAALNSCGVHLLRHSSRAFIPEAGIYRMLAEQCGSPNPVIIDGGAHTGAATKALMACLPHAEFHCFEPDPGLHQALTRNLAGNPGVHIVQAALGDRPAEAEFNINASPATNSLLQPSAALQPDLEALCRLVSRIKVKVVTIDGYCAENRIDRVDLIKLDLQGYDYRALRGAASVMGRTQAVLVEVLFREFYQGCGMFSDIYPLMRDYGFELFTLCGMHYGEASELLWADAIFVPRGRIAPGVRSRSG